MALRVVTIGTKNGLHARPAAVFARAAAAAPVRVTIATADRAPVPASSLLTVLTLGLERGQSVTLAAEGEGAEAVLDELAELLAADGSA